MTLSPIFLHAYVHEHGQDEAFDYGNLASVLVRNTFPGLDPLSLVQALAGVEGEARVGAYRFVRDAPLPTSLTAEALAEGIITHYEGIDAGAPQRELVCDRIRELEALAPNLPQAERGIALDAAARLRAYVGTPAEQLEAFLTSSRRYGSIVDPAIVVGLRRTARFLFGQYYPSVEIMTVLVDASARRQGYFTRFARLCADRITDRVVSVESILDPAFASALEAHGWKHDRGHHIVPGTLERVTALSQEDAFAERMRWH